MVCACVRVVRTREVSMELGGVDRGAVCGDYGWYVEADYFEVRARLPSGAGVGR